MAERNRLLVAEQEARETAESALEARDVFLSTAAHELRTPVTILKASSEILLRRITRGEVDWRQLEPLLNIIHQSAKRMAQVTDNLVEVSRIQMGLLSVPSNRVDLTELVEHAIQRARHQFGGEHYFVFERPSRAVLTRGDRERLDEVMANVLENSIKYSPSTTDIVVETRSGSNGEVMLTVCDGGIGFPSASAEAIFEPFGRGLNVVSSHLPGMGLGLYISKKIVESHGGRISAEGPGEGLGTKISVWLPAWTKDVPGNGLQEEYG